MSKKSREAIKDNLARAIAPPTVQRKRGTQLDALLDEYAPLDQPAVIQRLAAVPLSGAAQSAAPDTLAAPAIESAAAPESAAATVLPHPRPVAAPDSQSPPDTTAGAAYLSGGNSLVELLPDGPVIDKWTPVPNAISDTLQPLLKPQDFAVLTRLYRLAQGFGNKRVRVSNPRLAKSCNVSERDLRRILGRLVGHNLIVRVDTDFNSSNQTERGMVIDVNLPAVNIKASAKQSGAANQAGAASVSGAVRLADNKYKDLKEINKKGVASLDYKNCPDCNGTGMWYPEGYEKGAAKCKHDKLKSGA